MTGENSSFFSYIPYKINENWEGRQLHLPEIKDMGDKKPGQVTGLAASYVSTNSKT